MVRLKDAAIGNFSGCDEVSIPKMVRLKVGTGPYNWKRFALFQFLKWCD